MTQGFTKTAKIFHWLTALLWIVAWIVIVITLNFKNLDGLFTHTYFGDAISFHKALGTFVLFLTLFRIIWRIFHTPPEIETFTPFYKSLVSAGQLLLYVFALVLLPISGWLTSNAAGYPVKFLGLYPLPNLIPKDPILAPIITNFHITLGLLCGLLVLGHIFLALKHHFIDKDRTLKNMM